MQIKVTIESSGLARLRDGSAMSQARMMAGLDELGELFVSTARQSAGGGRFAQSFAWTRDGDAVVAGSSSPLASIIEKGRKPGRRPPTSSRVSPAAATRIAQSGTKGRFVVKKTATKIRQAGHVQRIARQVVIDISKG